MSFVKIPAPAPLLGLAALVLGFGWPGTSLADLRFRALPDGSSYLTPLETNPVNLPSGWRYQLQTGTSYDPNSFGEPKVTVTYDPLTGRVRESYLEGNVDVLDPLVTSNADYTSLLSSRTLRRSWRTKTGSTRSVTRSQAARGGLFRLEIPIQFPKVMRSIIGDGAPNLEVSGSETITLSGKSDWTVNQTTLTAEGKRAGAFPSFEMQQDLNVNLTGSIGDKIKVDVDQSSGVQTSLDNKVKLRYEGDDDDMIKLVELGNTNLSLQGASIRQEGLFGIKTAAKLGNFDLVTIASKQEGKNETAQFTPSGERARVNIRDLEYIKGQYFLITDHYAKLDYNTLEIWKDDANGNNNGGDDVDPGYARLDPTLPPDSTTNPQEFGHWTKLKFNIDYTIKDDYWDVGGGLKVPVIRLTNPVQTYEMLAVAYIDQTPSTPTRDYPDTVGYGRALKALAIPALDKGPDTLLLKMVKPRADDLDVNAIGDYDTTGVWFPVIPYEMRNFYDLGVRNISTTTMSFTIRRQIGGEAVYPDQIDNVPIIRLLGLDQLDQLDQAGFDNRVDARYIDAERGILFFPDLNPFDPAGLAGTDCGVDSMGFLCLNDTFRNRLRRDPVPTVQTANPFVYYRSRTDLAQDSRYFIDAEFQSSRQGYFLGKFNILEGSERVKINDITVQRDIDYSIDYVTGQLTFRRSLGPNDRISVDYSFAPGAAQVQRTLAGFSGTYSPSADHSFSGSFLYESKGAQEELVKFGEEPATSMIGDLSTVLAFRPGWMTDLTNKIPGIRTSQASALSFQGSYSASVPNPNTNGEAFLDDMEGNRETNSVSLSRTQWIWSGVPVGRSATVADHANIQWYNPANAVKEHDLKPVLEDDEGGESSRQVLELNILPPTGNALISPEDWTGVTLPLATVGQDLTKVQFIEIWVNDFRWDHTQTKGKLRIDFGRVDEDAFWDRNNPPNTLLDTEDKPPRDGRLDRPDDETDPLYEDTGLDGKIDPLEDDGYDENTNPDPAGDNYFYESPSTDYSRINNTEGNGLNDPNARPDTEDLNRNGVLERDNRYFEATIDLASSRYVAIDVPQLYATDPDVMENPENGWRLFRIPIADSSFTREGLASWTNVQAVRVWVDSMDTPMRLQIGGIEMIGSRWLRQAFPDSSYLTRGVTLEVRTRNNKDDFGIYRPPYQVEDAVGSTSDRREQSLALGYSNLASGDSVFAFKTYSMDAASGLGWALYRELRFYVHGDTGVSAQNLRVVARFGPDTLNYYEYSAPVRSGWQSIVVPMERLSGLKETRAGQSIVIDRDTGAAAGEVYAVVGNPSFTRMSRVSMGLTVDGVPAAPAFGEVWIDELRLSDVRKDRGYNASATVQANFANFASVNASFNRQDQDYFRVGQGGTQGSGFDHTALGLSSTLNLDQFLPGSGLNLPVSMALQHTTDVPRFRTGSDVVLEETRSKAETREFNHQSINVAYRKTGARKGISRYTLDAITGGLNYSKQSSISPQSSDSSWNFTTNGAYNIPIGGNGFRIGPLRVNPVPRTIEVAADWTSTRTVNYARTLNDTADVQEIRADLKQRLLGLRTLTSFEPLSSVRLTYALRSQRDMLRHQSGGLFGANKGTEIAHEQTVTMNYKPKWLAIMQPDIMMTGRYVENATSQRRQFDQSGLKDISNTGTARVTMVVPISRLGGRNKAAKDTSGSLVFLAPLRFVFSKFQDVQGSFDFQRGSQLTRVAGDPGLAFKSGFTQVFEQEIRETDNTVFQTARQYSARGNTAFQPIDKLTFDIRGDYRLSFSESYGDRRNEVVSWPEVSATWRDLQRLLRLERTFSTMTLTSSYRLETSENGPKGGLVEERTSALRLFPIIGWDLVLRNGIRVSAKSNYDESETSDENVVGFSRERQNLTTSVRIDKTFPASKGIKLPWKKHRVRLPNDMNLGGTIDIGSTRSILHQLAGDYPEQDFDTFTIRSLTNYNFSQSIAGGFNLEFRQNKDNKFNVTRRGITLAFTGTFRF
jgi:hypothetical protein